MLEQYPTIREQFQHQLVTLTDLYFQKSITVLHGLPQSGKSYLVEMLIDYYQKKLEMFEIEWRYF